MKADFKKQKRELARPTSFFRRRLSSGFIRHTQLLFRFSIIPNAPPSTLSMIYKHFPSRTTIIHDLKVLKHFCTISVHGIFVSVLKSVNRLLVTLFLSPRGGQLEKSYSLSAIYRNSYLTFVTWLSLWIIELQMSADDSGAKRDNDKNMAENSSLVWNFSRRRGRNVISPLTLTLTPD